MTKSRFARGVEMRRKVTGAARADDKLADTSSLNQRWQRLIIENAWGDCWSDPTLSRRERSILVLGMLAALGKSEEFEGHVRNAFRNGLSEAELEAILVQIAAYCGIPAGNGCFRAMRKVFAEPRPQPARE